MSWTTSFQGNPIAILAHLMGKDYGMTPTDVLDRPAWRFWMDARIRAAGLAFEREQREQARSSRESAGVANHRERQELVDAQESRADRREQRDGQPALEDQLAALDGER